MINKKLLLETLEQLRNEPKFNQYLKDNYSSYDGFLSFTPNSYIESYNHIVNEGNEHDQAIAGLINYLIDKNKIKDIEIDMYYNWSENGYNGLDYKVVEE